MRAVKFKRIFSPRAALAQSLLNTTSHRRNESKTSFKRITPLLRVKSCVTSFLFSPKSPIKKKLIKKKNKAELCYFLGIVRKVFQPSSCCQSTESLIPISARNNPEALQDKKYTGTFAHHTRRNRSGIKC